MVDPACALLFGAVAAGYTLTKPNVYRSEVLLALNMGGKASNLSRMAGQFGGLASLAGINLGGSGTDKKTVALEVLKSRAFLGNFIRSHNPEVYDTGTQAWLPKDDGTPGAPTDWDLVKAFRSILSVSEDKTTGMVRVAIETQSPQMSQAWVHALVSDLNEHMRQSDIECARRSISYLQSQLEETNIIEMQQIFYELIEQQTRTMMLARVRDEYIFKTVDPAVIPQEKAGPKRALMVVLGGMLGLFAIFVRHFIKNTAEDER